MDNDQIVKILLDTGYVTDENISDYKDSGYPSVISFLYEKELMSPDVLGQAFSEYYKIPYADLNSKIPDRDLVLQIPEEIAREYRVVLFKKDGKNIVLATDNPTQANKLVKEGFFKGYKVEIRYGLTDDLKSIIKFYGKHLTKRVETLLETESDLVAIDLLNEIVQYSVEIGVSDIHFEPMKDKTIIRLRKDGVLEDAVEITPELYTGLLNKVKVDAKLRIDMHNATMDGAIRYEIEDGEVDLRISIAPTVDGEKIVIRVLSRYVDNLLLPKLGFSDVNAKIVKDAIKKPYGMIVVAGPTGSGKTTTLYTFMRMLNKREINITTIEDPVEYKMFGVNQIQVNREQELTFARGLRSVVRQDPDIIMVGEVRDLETAEISVNSALTGHMLLTTFHANDASTVIPRFIDMGVEPFLLSSTLEVVVSQRLVRKLCESCRYSEKAKKEHLSPYMTPAVAKKFGKDLTLYFSKGCPVCNHTGYSGRIGIYEVIKMDQEMRDLVQKSPSSQDIWKLAAKKGAVSLYDDGLEKVRLGVTTLEELSRVAKPVEM